MAHRVKSTSCFPKGTRFHFQYPHGDPQLPLPDALTSVGTGHACNAHV